MSRVTVAAGGPRLSNCSAGEPPAAAMAVFAARPPHSGRAEPWGRFFRWSETRRHKSPAMWLVCQVSSSEQALEVSADRVHPAIRVVFTMVKRSVIRIAGPEPNYFSGGPRGLTVATPSGSAIGRRHRRARSCVSVWSGLLAVKNNNSGSLVPLLSGSTGY